MRRCLLAAVLAAFALTGCGDNKSKDVAPKAANPGADADKLKPGKGADPSAVKDTP